MDQDISDSSDEDYTGDDEEDVSMSGSDDELEVLGSDDDETESIVREMVAEAREEFEELKREKDASRSARLSALKGRVSIDPHFDSQGRRRRSSGSCSDGGVSMVRVFAEPGSQLSVGMKRMIQGLYVSNARLNLPARLWRVSAGFEFGSASSSARFSTCRWVA